MTRRVPASVAPDAARTIVGREHRDAVVAAARRCTSPFSYAVASTDCMNSWCSRWALLTSATVGRASSAR